MVFFPFRWKATRLFWPSFVTTRKKKKEKEIDRNEPRMNRRVAEVEEVAKY